MSCHVMSGAGKCVPCHVMSCQELANVFRRVNFNVEYVKHLHCTTAHMLHDTTLHCMALHCTGLPHTAWHMPCRGPQCRRPWVQVAHTPHCTRMAHTPHCTHVAHTPHCTCMAHTPHCTHVARTPRIAHPTLHTCGTHTPYCAPHIAHMWPQVAHERPGARLQQNANPGQFGSGADRMLHPTDRPCCTLPVLRPTGRPCYTLLGQGERMPCGQACRSMP